MKAKLGAANAAIYVKGDIQTRIAEAYDSCDGDIDAALAELEIAYTDDSDFSGLLFKGLVLPALRGVLRGIAGERRRILNWREGLGRKPKIALRLIAAQNLDSLFNYVVAGEPLGNCCRSQVVSAASTYRKHMKGSAHPWRWLTLIAGKLPDDDRTVSQMLSLEVLRRLHQEARKWTNKGFPEGD